MDYVLPGEEAGAPHPAHPLNPDSPTQLASLQRWPALHLLHHQQSGPHGLQVRGWRQRQIKFLMFLRFGNSKTLKIVKSHAIHNYKTGYACKNGEYKFDILNLIFFFSRLW